MDPTDWLLNFAKNNFALIAAVWFLFWSLRAFNSFVNDKNAAIAGRRRIPERSLLGLTGIGGAMGGVLASQMFRHKTRKQPFTDILFRQFLVQALLILGIVAADFLI